MSLISFKLKKGDKVGIIAPGSKIDKDKLFKGIKIIESWGLNPIIGKNVFKENMKYFSATDEERASDFQSFIDDVSIKAIWCARGGYGSQRIINLVNWKNFFKKPKWIIGFSDVTFLLNYIASKGIPTIHGPMIVSLEKTDQKCISVLQNFLFENIFSYEIQDINVYNLEIREKKISARIFGGNLSLMQTTIGVCDNYKKNNNILFFEDTSEYMYRIDRIIQHLKLAGVFNKTKAIILGTFDNILENKNYDYSLKSIFTKILNRTRIVLIENFPAGHSTLNYPFIIGSECNISFSSDSLNIEFCC